MKTDFGKFFVLLCLAAGVLLACSKPPGSSLVGTDWTLLSLNGHDLIPGKEITATFNGREIAGFAGCNLYSIEVEVNDNSLVFKHRYAAITETLCLKEGIMEQEQEYTTALESVSTYILSDEKLELKNEDGDVVLSYMKGLPEGFPE